MNDQGSLVVTDGLLRLESRPVKQASTPRRLLFLDRDGVINELVPDCHSGMNESPLEESSVRLIPGAGQALARLLDGGFVPIFVSNQPAAAKGRVSVARLLAVHRRVIELMQALGATVPISYLCLHHPAGIVPALSGSCACRKPSPGMLLIAARELGSDPSDAWMVGDTDADIGAGRAAGCKTALLGYPGSFHKRGQGRTADLKVESLTQLAEAVEF